MISGKIVILGAGHVGSHVASALALAGLAREIVLIDTDAAKAAAQALDVSDSVSSIAANVTVRTGTYAECEDASLVFCAIGEPRAPGQTRLDLLDRSVELMDILIGQLNGLTITCPFVTITNPADVVADYLRKHLGFSRSQCFSTGTLLDTARLRRILSEATGVDRRSITAFALGEHGDSSMVAFSCGMAAARSLTDYHLNEQELVKQTRLAGMDIINGKGSTEFGIGAAAADLAAAILRDEHRLLPVSVLLEGEYGQNGIHCGVPCIIGRSGVECVVELPLTPDEQAMLDASCAVIRQHIEKAAAHSSL